jgi:hypothetical protein
MTEPTTFTLACIVAGALLIAMTLGGSFIARLPLSAAMLYLGVGVAVSPVGLGLLRLDALKNTVLLERLTEVAVLISLFTAGMKLEFRAREGRWRIPVQLATVSMVVTVGAITALGVYVLNLPVGAAVLLGAILAPTDPVLASDVQVANPGDRDRLRFGLTGEGGLNDGTAFPFVMLGLGLLGLHELGDNGWRWWAIDVLWAVAGGLALGWLLGTLVGRAILYLRMRHREALGSDEFIALGLIGLTYGLALLFHTYGFLAVFAAGLALRRIDEPNALPLTPAAPDETLSPDDQEASGAEAPRPHDARRRTLQQPAGKLRGSRHRAGRGRAGGHHPLSRRSAVVHSGAVPGDPSGCGFYRPAGHTGQGLATPPDGLVRHSRHRLSLLPALCHQPQHRTRARPAAPVDHTRRRRGFGDRPWHFGHAADETL